jgi:chromate transport protein ChrA
MDNKTKVGLGLLLIGLIALIAGVAAIYWPAALIVAGFFALYEAHELLTKVGS